jgi:hypothetical protein
MPPHGDRACGQRRGARSQFVRDVRHADVELGELAVTDLDRFMVLRERLRQMKLDIGLIAQFNMMAAGCPGHALPLMRELLAAGPQQVKRVNAAFLAVTV